MNAQGTAAKFKNPADVAVDRSGNVYVTDRLNHQIRKIEILSGDVTTLAGKRREFRIKMQKEHQHLSINHSVSDGTNIL